MQSLDVIGAHIRHIRKAKKLSAAGLAERSGIHRNTLQALETGKGNIELSKLLSICAELGLELLLVPHEVAPLRAAQHESVRTELSERLHTLMSNGS